MNWKLILIVILVAASGTLFTVTVYNHYYVLERQVLPIQYTIETGVLGLNTDTDMLRMGAVSPGGSSAREVTFTARFPSSLTITFDGRAGQYMKVKPNNFEVDQGENVSLSFSVHPPKDVTMGNYTGSAILTFYRR